MEADIQVLGRLVEVGRDGRAVGLEGQARRRGLADAVAVGEAGVGRDDELVARLELLVPDQGRLPDGEAGRVAEPRPGGLDGVADWIPRVFVALAWLSRFIVGVRVSM